ncbi:efflux RND transporter permease subunit [Thauera linaloolentis]|uniref:RND efflux transporter n=1 Tax=Thauera linaloolentis (strain DSM 12138 / JCM 21573 / CCUG 41526 / CIP 105981 / IAM 15112 / NBRC 102519 / 47Lol) TaxID=1123367 RepID=N6Y8B8_THAL4|nr:MMPL family transporter [Thauera linaloolentis]ENO87795.1 RND efflux transporter [Thauera linaloolentis 47Lol = DSM 12138]MCM8565282.1 MMPL family transporter [Thauera linaloolentis]
MSQKEPDAGDADLVHHSVIKRFEQFFELQFERFRLPALFFFGIASVFFAFQAVQLEPEASFQKMVPSSHPFIQNFLAYENELRPLGNVVRIVVENRKGEIYTPEFLNTLKQVTDEVFYIPGVSRGGMKSVWTPNVVWNEVTEDGFVAGQIIPPTFDGSLEAAGQVRTNVARAGIVGTLVANDHRSAVILAPLQEVDPETGEKLDYARLSQRLEESVRDKYASEDVNIRIVGFAKIVGDLIEGAAAIGGFFGITFALTVVVLWLYSRCWRSTLATVFCCSLAVIWQLGVVRLLGLGLDPYSILVPFLTFAIGVSHAVQNISTMAVERMNGRSNIEAAKATFRVLFIPGSIALLCNAVGFSTLLVIDIGVIRELAISASIGVGVIIFTKMFLLPVLMSYLGVSPAALAHQARRMRGGHRWAHVVARVTDKRMAWGIVAAGAVVLALGHTASRDLKIGDLDPGAPELRVDSRYNIDNAFVVEHYSTSSDVFVVMVKTEPGECGAYPVAATVDQLQWHMENVPGVEGTSSLFSAMKKVLAGQNGGDLRWESLTRNRYSSNAAHRLLPSELFNSDCSMVPVLIFLEDHKAETLIRVVDAVQRFAAEHGSDGIEFELAAGNAGIEAATNSVIKQSKPLMLGLEYAIVALLVLWEFKSWRVTVCIMLPLFITSVLCEGLMAMLGLGVKVATLPVIALGIGIGVDYGIYIYNKLEHYLEKGLALKDAYVETLKTTGGAVALTGVMLALGVATWIFSDIKFQADMGLLLTFMFLWNMFGAVVMIPALASLLIGNRGKGAGGGIAVTGTMASPKALQANP